MKNVFKKNWLGKKFHKFLIKTRGIVSFSDAIFIFVIQVAEMYRNQDSVKNSAAPTNPDEDDFY